MSRFAGSIALVLYDPSEVELQLLDADGNVFASAALDVPSARKVAADIINLCDQADTGAAMGPAQGSA